MGSPCEHGNEPAGSIKCGEFLDRLRDYQFLDKACSMELVTNRALRAIQ
jgi:hypothetical protein